MHFYTKYYTEYQSIISIHYHIIIHDYFLFFFIDRIIMEQLCVWLSLDIFYCQR